MRVQMRPNCWVVAWANQHHGHAARRCRNDVGVFCLLNGETKCCKKRRSGCQIDHCNNNVIDTNGNRVERTQQRVGDFCWRSIAAFMSNFDAVRLRQNGAKNLLGKVGIDAAVNCPLPASGEYFAHALRLDHCSCGSGLHLGNFATYFHSLCEQRNDRGINLIDLLS